MAAKVNNKEKNIMINEDSSIHTVYSWPFFSMQFFGFMPLQGIFKKELNKIKFSWLSLRTLYAITTSIGILILTISQTIRFFLFKVEMDDISRIWHFVKAWLTTLFFIMLAMDWKNFLIKWNNFDKAMIKFGKPGCIKKKVELLLICFVILFFGDFILIQVQRIHEDIIKGDFSLSMEKWNYYQTEKRFKFIYEMFPYDFFSGCCLLVMQLQILFAGTFLDLFIMVTSLCLAVRMKTVVKRIRQISIHNDVPQIVWVDIREGYNRLEVLCRYVNSKIGYALLLSFIGNLGIMLIQLFNSLRVKRTDIDKTYFYYAFFFLLSKTLAVCIFGSKINDESQKPLIYLYRTEDSAYNIEVDRLILQISRNNMALSSMNLFDIRRNIVLKIAGSIVTYELVFIQFAGDYLKDQHFSNRTTSL